MEYRQLRKKEILTLATTGMNLENITLGARQTQKDRCYVIRELPGGAWSQGRSRKVGAGAGRVGS